MIAPQGRESIQQYESHSTGRISPSITPRDGLSSSGIISMFRSIPIRASLGSSRPIWNWANCPTRPRNRTITGLSASARVVDGVSLSWLWGPDRARRISIRASLSATDIFPHYPHLWGTVLSSDTVYSGYPTPEHDKALDRTGQGLDSAAMLPEVPVLTRILGPRLSN